MTEKKIKNNMSSSGLTRRSRNKDLRADWMPDQVGHDRGVESGRSMVEMLGVLAVVGVLSVGSIAGYTYAMNRYYANELIMGASERAVLVTAQIVAGREPSLREFADIETAGGVFSDDVADDIDGGFGIAVSGVKGAVCENLKKMVDGTEVFIANDDTDLTDVSCQDTDNAFLFVYKNGFGSAGGNGGDMTAKDCRTRACCDSFGGEWESKDWSGGYTCVLDGEELKCTIISEYEYDGEMYYEENCIACPVDQVGKCGPYGCACADKEEDIVCDDYKCVACPDGDAEACLSEGISCSDMDVAWDCLECPTGQVKHCPENNSYGNCACAEAEADICDDYGCVVCPDGLIPKCADTGCYCVESLDYLSCETDEYGDYVCELNCPDGQVEIYPDGSKYRMCGVVQEECPAGQVRKCAEWGDPAYGGCACADKEEQIFCDLGMCIACPEGQIGYCPSALGYCYCTDQTEENKYCCGYNCIVCPEGETGQCAVFAGPYDRACACGADVNCGLYGCIGCPEGKTAYCASGAGDSSSDCLCADENDDVYCEESGCGCIIVPPGHTADCTWRACITCPAGQAPVCDDGAENCECQTCQTGEQVSCVTDEYGDQVCRCCPNGTTLVLDEDAWAYVCR